MIVTAIASIKENLTLTKLIKSRRSEPRIVWFESKTSSDNDESKTRLSNTYHSFQFCQAINPCVTCYLA